MQKVSSKTEKQIRAMLASRQTCAEIRSETGVGNSAITRIKNEIKGEHEVASAKHPKPRFDMPPARKIDPLAILRQAADRVAEHPPDPDYHKIVIPTDIPVAVMKAADFHFGGLDVAYEALMAHAEFLLKVPNFYMQLFGDDLNLMIMHRVAGARHDGWTPEEQVAWLEAFVDECLDKDKLLSMAWGNHSDEFTERNAGFGLVRMLMKHKVPYFRGLGYIDLQVGDQTYPIGFTHKTRFHSFMNPTHGNKRMEQMHAEFFGASRPLCREYITAHTHYPGFSQEGCLPEDRIMFIKCGTFKTNCLFSQRYFGQGRIGVPTVVYHPDRFEHVLFPTPWEAYRYMTGRDFN